MVSVLGLKPGHDGAAALVVDGELVFSLEAEKDSFERYSPLTASVLVEALAESPVFPDVVALGGWYNVLPGRQGAVAAGSRGLAAGALVDQPLLGRPCRTYSSSHERSHLYGGVAMSPFDPEGDLAVLVWEGVLGAFYRWRGSRASIECHEVLNQPGARYAALYDLADPGFADSGSWPRGEASGKLMALAGLADSRSPSRDSVEVVEALLRARALYPFYKRRFRRSGLYNCGIPDAEHSRAARYLSERLFEVYLDAAQRLLPKGLPLVVAGGCGLNCDWNSAWRASGWFSDVFVAPCPNDSGSAIGTAVDAAVQAGAACRLTWDVYRGARFVHDLAAPPSGWTTQPLDPAALSRWLEEGEVVAWVQGRCEIGPRALGNRSLLASAAEPLSHKRLNTIKQREPYRPIAPVCLEEDLGRRFDRDPDPHMLYFRRVREDGRERIPAVTHADGSARTQSVTEAGHPRLHQLLTAHRTSTGIGVLCNTSLNFNGRGFINRASDLFHYCDEVGLDHVVVDDRWYTR